MGRRAKSESPEETSRFSAKAWVDLALEALAEQGIDGVRIEGLAKVMEVTKGSFYWHFKDRNALHEAMLAAWRRHATLNLIERLDRGATTPQDRLRRLMRLPLVGERSLKAANIELAIRLWGRRDPRARQALEEVDELRLRYISGLLRDCGLSEDESQARAILIYSYMRVAATLIPKDGVVMMDQCEAILLGPHI